MELITIDRQNISENDWDEFVNNSPQGGPYLLYQYMTILAPQWQALVVSNSGEWQAVMPVAVKKKWGISYILQPPFTQFWGICYKYNIWKNVYEEYSWKHKVGTLLVEELKKYHWVVLNFSPHFDDPLPFHWEGFRLHTRVTYELVLTQGKERIYNQFASSLKHLIRRAEKNGLSFQETTGLEELITLISLNEEEGNFVLGKHEHRTSIFQRLGQWLLKSSYGRCYNVKNTEGEVLAAGLFVIFRKRIYYLTGAYAPNSGPTGATSFLLWKAMVHAIELGCEYWDFEGSMIKGIEQFFRKFGSYPVQYLQIKHNQLPLLIRWTQELIS